MPKQPAIPGLREAMKKQATRREQLLAEMDAVVPWGRPLGLIAAHHPKTGPKGGRPPETMPRAHFPQDRHALSDPVAEGPSVKQSIRWIDGSAGRRMAARRCAAWPGSSRAATASPMRPPSSTSAIRWSGTG